MLNHGAKAVLEPIIQYLSDLRVQSIYLLCIMSDETNHESISVSTNNNEGPLIVRRQSRNIAEKYRSLYQPKESSFIIVI